MSKIRVLVVDDHAIVRQGICALLGVEPDVEVIGEAEDGPAAITKAAELRPDIVLMDIGMPTLNGLEATREIKAHNPDIQVLALTVHDSSEYFFRILEAGASGYVLKGSTSNELVSAMRAVYRGGVFLDPLVAKKVVADYLKQAKSGEDKGRYDGLSEREREVLTLIGDGRTNQEIAQILTLSPNTVQTHRSRIMEKLNLHNRAQLMKYAMRKGLVDTNA